MSLEFLALYTFTISPGYSLATPNVIQFLLNGMGRSMYIIEFGLQFGYLQAKWFQETENVVHKLFSDNLDGYWREIALTPAFWKGNKDKELKDPALRVYHRFLAANLYAQIDGIGNITILRFFILYCMNRPERST